MDIKPIKTDADYRGALKEIESLMMAETDTPEGARLDVLVIWRQRLHLLLSLC